LNIAHNGDNCSAFSVLVHCDFVFSRFTGKAAKAGKSKGEGKEERTTLHNRDRSFHDDSPYYYGSKQEFIAPAQE
jgi:hypothetical protein